MKTYYLDTTIPELYHDEEFETQFILPFNIPAILFKLENEEWKPVWITSTYLKLVGKDNPTKKTGRTSINSLIKNNIITGFEINTYNDILREVQSQRRELKISFQNQQHETRIYKNLINAFRPLFHKRKGISHIIFYLNNYKQKNTSLYFNNTIKEKKELNKSRIYYDKLFNNYGKIIIEIDNQYKITKLNNKAIETFPSIKINKSFIENWNEENQSIFYNSIKLLKTNKEVYFTCFEKVNNKSIKLKIKLIGLNYESTNSYLVFVENLNTSMEMEKELNKKGMLLQLTQIIGQNLEKNNNEFLKQTFKNIIFTYDFNGLYWLPFYQKENNKKITVFPNQQILPIHKEIYDSHYESFKNLNKGYIKRIEIDRIYQNNKIEGFDLTRSQFLIVVPIYEENVMVGTMNYLSNTKSMDIDLYSQLHGISVIYCKLMIFQSLFQRNLSEINYN